MLERRRIRRARNGITEQIEHRAGADDRWDVAGLKCHLCAFGALASAGCRCGQVPMRHAEEESVERRKAGFQPICFFTSS
jgi:hypothetical protein